MVFFVDTADTAEIKSLAASGLLDGVTTNPFLVTKTGKKFPDIVREIRDPVRGQVGGEIAHSNHDRMMREASARREPSGNIIHPPTGKGRAAFPGARPGTGQTIA